jgi:hypothetical protein
MKKEITTKKKFYREPHEQRREFRMKVRVVRVVRLVHGYSRVWFNTPSNLRFTLAPAQMTQRPQKFGIKPKNLLASSRGRVL